MSAKMVEPGSRLMTMLTTNYGMTPGTLQRIGALFLMCAAFELDLEKAIWRLKGEAPRGAVPTTDNMPAGQRIAIFRKLGLERQGEIWRDIVDAIADMAQYVTEYRNAMGHGRLLPTSVGGGMLLNAASHGEIRTRPARIAHIDERLVGIMLNALHELLITMQVIAEGAGDPSTNPQILSRRGEIQNARSGASEVRYLNEYMNHEKN
jgi:hypothetical protein